MTTLVAYASCSAASSALTSRTVPPDRRHRRAARRRCRTRRPRCSADERFIASAISLVRMAPAAPTSAPAMISGVLSSTNPAIATAVPVNALSSEMTTGMSAPPIGSVPSTPSASADEHAAAAAPATPPCRGRIGQPAGQRDQEQRRGSRQCPPRNVIGRPGIRPASLPAATTEPENVTPPMSRSSTVASVVGDRQLAERHRSVVADRVAERDERRRAAADRVEHADQLRHRGHRDPAGGDQARRPRRRPRRARARRSRSPCSTLSWASTTTVGSDGQRHPGAPRPGCRAGRWPASSSGAGRARSRPRTAGRAGGWWCRSGHRLRPARATSRSARALRNISSIRSVTR